MNAVEVWQHAISEFANAHGLPADAIHDGAPFQWGDWRFSLQRNEQLDPNGLVVMMDLGEIPEATAAQVQLEMLAHNARRASALLGYLGIVPGTNRSVYCVHLDDRNTDEPAALIAAVVQSLATSLANSVGNFESMFEKLKKNDPPL